MENISDYLKDITSIDTRALAIFRIFAGILIIIDVLLRFRNLELFYTDNGATPVTLMMENIPWHGFSIHTLSGDPIFISILFIIQILFGIQLILGYKTRIAIIISFLLVVSVDFRNVYITSYSDTLFRLLLFWSIFLPLGEKWSIDSMNRSRNPNKEVFSIATVLILLQMLSMYILNGFHKYGFIDSWWFTSEGLVSILKYTRVSYLFADYMLYLPDFILTIMNTGWFIILILSPLLLILRGRKRLIFVALFVASHLGLALTVRIGAFSFVSILGLILFVESDTFDNIERKINDIRGKSVVTEGKITGFKFNNQIILSLIYIILIISGFYMAFSTFGYLAPVVDDRDDIQGLETFDDTYDTFRLSQPSWSFYTTTVPLDRYSVAVAETENGDIIDVFADDKFIGFTDRHSGNAHKTFDTYRHRFYHNSVFRDNYFEPEMGDRQYYYLSYLCNNYTHNGDDIDKISVYHIMENYGYDNLDYDTVEFQSRIVASKGCGNNEPDDIVVPDYVLDTNHSGYTDEEIEELINRGEYHKILD